jgi:hypothetical protein
VRGDAVKIISVIFAVWLLVFCVCVLILWATRRGGETCSNTCAARGCLRWFVTSIERGGFRDGYAAFDPECAVESVEKRIARYRIMENGNITQETTLIDNKWIYPDGYIFVPVTDEIAVKLRYLQDMDCEKREHEKWLEKLEQRGKRKREERQEEMP